MPFRKKNLSSLLLTCLVLLPFNGSQANDSMNDYENCIFHVEVQYELDMKKASDNYYEELNNCRQVSTEEEVSLCKSNALQKFDSEKEKFQSILNKRKWACLKMPHQPF